MKITTVKYGRTFSLGSFQSERIDFEASVDDGETPEQVLLSLKERCNNFHQETNKGLYIVNMGTGEVRIPSESAQTQESPPFAPKTQPYSTIEAINSCTTLKVLQEFDLIVKNMSNKYPEIQEAYDNKLKELT